MNLSFQDFYRALSNQGASNGGLGVPYTQLVQPHDYMSESDQNLARQKMLQDRGSTSINTIDPGQTWGGRDKNNFDPQDLMDDSASRWLRMEKI